MKENTNNYAVLNELAKKGGTVIFGGKEDMNIPLCELKQAFELDGIFYNRSIEDLSVANAAEHYEVYISDLEPDTVLLHIGEADLDLFNKKPSEFIRLYRELIVKIKTLNKKCRIAVISLKNYNNEESIAQFNKQLKYLADSERCEFVDISEKKIWNPKGTKDVISFVYSVGFLHPLKIHKPIYDLVKILFCI